jgi:hypothetical protein
MPGQLKENVVEKRRSRDPEDEDLGPSEERGKGEIENPRRLSLDEDDLVFHLHIPRTAGTTLYEVMASHFPAASRLKGGSSVALERILASVPVEMLDHYRLISGLCETNAARLFGRMPHFVTMLREPLSRLMSRFEAIKREPKHSLHAGVRSGEVGFFEYLRHRDGGIADANMQVVQIASTAETGRGVLDLDRWMVLELARERLEEFAVFGIRERMEDSVALLAGTFGWDAPLEIPHLEATVPDNHHLRLAAREISLASEQNELDLRFYEIARRIFHERTASLVAASREREANAPAPIPG